MEGNKKTHVKKQLDTTKCVFMCFSISLDGFGSFEKFKYEFALMDEFKLFKTTIKKCKQIEKHMNTHF